MLRGVVRDMSLQAHQILMKFTSVASPTVNVYFVNHLAQLVV